MDNKPSIADQLDIVDKQILNILLQDATISYTKIAEQIHTSAGTVHVRIKKMRQLGIILGQHLSVDPRPLGYDLCAFVGLHLEKAQWQKSILAALQGIPEVLNLHQTTGQYSLFLQLRCRDSEHLRQVLEQIQHLEGVQRLESFISLAEPIRRSLSLPIRWTEDE